MNRREELIEAYAEFLNRFDWDWFVTLTFRGFPSASKANRVFAQFIYELKKSAGGWDFRWFRVTEKGRFGGGLHFHSLIGGLKSAAQRTRWKCRWEQIAGDARIEPYDPDEDGIYYILKTLNTGGDYEFDMDLGQGLVRKSWYGDL
jgi:hypothetical protein